ncbi:transglycosylase domain-containing protein [Paenibacillus sp. MBLB4367]|uniref:transglycosylase domain-containing protein n=1 Tax=Paenibacillus sp. MBLB4367 TaxID=3384767 RepID=UPI003907F29E
MHIAAATKAGHAHTRPAVPKKKNNRPFLFLKRLTLLLLAAAFLFAAGWAGLLAAGQMLIGDKKLPALSSAANDGSRTVPITEMPAYIANAFVAVEDHRFQSHEGVDFRSLARALWVDLREGGKAQGGSTITMQLARNLFLTQDKTYSRKLKEIAIAVSLERQYTKEQLLELYLGSIYFGHGIYGLDNAADYYFGKTIRAAGDAGKPTIGLHEAAILAALPKAPEYYSPVKFPDKALERQKLVLERMVELGLITGQEKLDALREPLRIVPSAQVYARSQG